MSTIKIFDPQRDGWQFNNFGEGDTPFSWDLYRDTYLGIDPASPVDLGFYEIFKHCAKDGNCGGMSLLALALFKFGGYMGFCSPARYYTGDTQSSPHKGPDREDLRRGINILQARQFNAHSIEHFVDIVDAGNLNDAEAAFKDVKEYLGRGDYPILSLANDNLGDRAHTVIPYLAEENPPGYPDGVKILHIWDSNYPYDVDPRRYNDYATVTTPPIIYGDEPPLYRTRHLVIRDSTNWEYRGQTHYKGYDGGWCFAIPMSLALTKARHPMTVDMAFDALMTIFVTGPGSAVSQISDRSGRRFYRTTGVTRTSRNDLETAPSLRLEGAARWPWYGQNTGEEQPGELYFLRHPAVSSPLDLTIKGTVFKVLVSRAGSLLEMESTSPMRTTDTIRISRLDSRRQSLKINTSIESKAVNIKQVLTKGSGRAWRCITIQNVNLGHDDLIVATTDDLRGVEISSPKDNEFNTVISHTTNGIERVRNIGKLSAVRDETLRIELHDWSRFGESEISVSRFHRT